jgi:hypothetical protein
MKEISVIVATMLVCLFAGCKKDSTTSPETGANANIPVIANTMNAFALNVTAQSYSATIEYVLSFSTDSLACSLTVVGQTLGNGILRVADSTNSTVYADSSLQSKVAASTQTGKGIPRKIKVVFNNYTGIISFAMARNK